MPIQQSDIKLRRAGAAGLGGAISTVDVMTAVFDKVVNNEAADGDRELRCAYVLNNGATAYDNIVAWILANTPSPSTIIEIGLGTSAVNGIEQTIANENTAPVGVSFVPATSKALGILLGSLPANAWRALWFRRTVTAGAAARPITDPDTWTPAIEGEAP